jgi:hypothetical protein
VGLVARDAARAAGERRAINLVHFEGAFGGYFKKAAPFFERAAKKSWWRR